MAENDPNPSSEPNFDLNDPDVKQVFDAYAEKVVEGLKGNEAKLKSEKQAERKARQEAEQRYQQLLEQLGGEEGVESLKSLREKFDREEDAELLKKGDFDALLSKRSKTLQDQFEQEKSKLAKQIEAAQKKADEEAKTRDLYRNRLASDRREAYLRKLWSERDHLIPEAVNDAALLAEKFIQYDPDTNEFAVVDEYGEPRQGTDGKPMTVEGWLESVVEGRSHWMKPSAGGGANGGKGGFNRTKNRSEMTSKEASAYVEQYGREKYLELPA